MSTDRRTLLEAEDRARLLRAANDCSLGERLLASLVLGEGLTLAQAVAVRGSDLSGTSVKVMTKTGKWEARALSSPVAELACRAAEQATPGSVLVTGRSGRPLSTAAARDVLLGLARTSGVRVGSVHELPADRPAVAVA